MVIGTFTCGSDLLEEGCGRRWEAAVVSNGSFMLAACTAIIDPCRFIAPATKRKKKKYGI